MNQSFVEKLSVAAGSAAVVVSPVLADAALLTVQGAPVSLAFNSPIGTTVAWDVDGVGQREFELFIEGGSFTQTFTSFRFVPALGMSTSVSVFYSSTNRTMQFASQDSVGTPLNGRGLVAPFATDNVQALGASFNVGPTLAAYTWGAGSTSGYRYRAAFTSGQGRYSTSNGLTGSSSFGPNAFSYDWNYGFVPGDNFFGFRFDDGVGGGLNYGWAVVNFDVTPGAETFTIVEWTYETQDDTAVHVGTRASAAVPEPASTLPAIALLAAGAAGVRRWRASREAA